VAAASTMWVRLSIRNRWACGSTEATRSAAAAKKSPSAAHHREAGRRSLESEGTTGSSRVHPIERATAPDDNSFSEDPLRTHVSASHKRVAES
jgi:hypothetical protein